MDYLNNLLVGPLNKLKTAGIILGSLCVGIIAVSSALLISHSIMSTESSSSTPNPILPLRLLRISSTTPNVTISHIVYDTLSTSDIKTIVNATNSSTELNWRYLWFNATVPINSSIVIDIELPLALCTNLTIYKYYNNTFQPNKATKINSTSCSFSINITDDDFKGDLSYGARRRRDNAEKTKYPTVQMTWCACRGHMIFVDQKLWREPIPGSLEREPNWGFNNKVAAFDFDGSVKGVDWYSKNFDMTDSLTRQALYKIGDPKAQYTDKYEDSNFGISHNIPGKFKEMASMYNLKTHLNNNIKARQDLVSSYIVEDKFEKHKNSIILIKVEPTITLSCLGDSLHNNTDDTYRIRNVYTKGDTNTDSMYRIEYVYVYEATTLCNVTTPNI